MEQQQYSSQVSETGMSQGQADFYRWMQTMEEELNALLLVWRGYTLKFDGEGKLIGYEKTNSPIMNEKGIQEVIAFLREFLTKNVTLSSVDEEVANKIIRQTGFAVNDMLFFKQTDYELDPARYSQLYISILNYVSFAVYRAVGGKTLTVIGKSTSLTESKTITPQQQQGGVFSRMFGKII